MVSNKTSFELDGLDEFAEKLAKLPKDLSERAAVRATAKAADYLRDTVKFNVPLAQKMSYAAMFRGNKITRNAGDLKDAVIIKRLPTDERKGFDSVHKVAFWRNDATKGIGYIAHLVEGDVAPHDIYQPSTGRTIHHGGSEGEEFFRRSIRTSRKKMNEIMEKEIQKALKDYFK